MTATAAGTATGPTSPEGKRRSSANAYTHGLTGQTLILTPEERLAYDRHCQGYHDLYKPVGHPEQILVQLIADDYWRALRGRAMETARLRLTFDGHLDENNGPILAPSNVWLHNEKALGNLALYLQRIERSIKNNTQALDSMQHQRVAQNQREEAPRQSPIKEQKEEVTLPARAACAPAHSAPIHSVPAHGVPSPSLPSHSARARSAGDHGTSDHGTSAGRPAPDFPPQPEFVFSAAPAAQRPDAPLSPPDVAWNPEFQPPQPSYRILRAA